MDTIYSCSSIQIQHMFKLVVFCLLRFALRDFKNCEKGPSLHQTFLIQYNVYYPNI